MTLTEALHRLHRAGKIRSPWLPGMLVEDAGGLHCRLLRAMGERGWIALRGGDTQNSALSVGFLSSARPVLTDPPTVGCLAALAREATGEPTLTVETVMTAARGIVWMASTPRQILGPERPTEGEAWAATITAAAERLPPAE